MRNKKKLINREVGQILRGCLDRYEGDEEFFPLDQEEFIELRRLLRRKATRARADAAFRAYMAVLDIPTTGSFSGIPMQNLAALAMSSRLIATFGDNAQYRLNKMAYEMKVSKTKANGHILHAPEGVALGK
jgi:hypothetical protein